MLNFACQKSRIDRRSLTTVAQRIIYAMDNYHETIQSNILTFIDKNNSILLDSKFDTKSPHHAMYDSYDVTKSPHHVFPDP